MNVNEVISICRTHLLPVLPEFYSLEGYEFQLIPAHEGGRNVVFSCNKTGSDADTDAKILRISFLADRNREDFLAELEYIRYLYDHGGSVSNVVSSNMGNLLEEFTHNYHTYYICMFEKARGKLLVENNYQYREGVPITEYYYNCGKVLGKMHQLSKKYTPVHSRYSFFDKYNAQYIDRLIPKSFTLLKEKMVDLLNSLKKLDKSRESFGMVHFDYSDGNYMIDYNTGDITVFDFDNSCFCWYMYDLANIWTHGVGWTQFEHDADKRKKFMEEYFATVLAGYKSETNIEIPMLDKLPLFINVTVMENIIDTFEVMRNNNEELEVDEELTYLIKCLEDDIPYKGFFHEIYSCEEPFEYVE
ncbi:MULTISPECIES: phosphotransferase enzyme family protein [Bacillaceae]|uniref:Phosphotransferase n=1 Tax=Evansella alkalicola TaxID=745819 RepID=A0ABS6JW43_9BACI|nr:MULTISPECIES: phosphotransferase [Bacillaceae]MBU9722816.1 phosphotransferase [Bacillus alkalicola]